MLAIRMKRLGRKGSPTYRVVVQDSRWAPTSGKVVANLGSYDPHTKTTTLVKEKAEFYLKNGAQPSDRVVKLFKSEGVKLPDWVNDSVSKTRSTRNPDKLRKNRPADTALEAKIEQPQAEETADSVDEKADQKVDNTETAESTSDSVSTEEKSE